MNFGNTYEIKQNPYSKKRIQKTMEVKQAEPEVAEEESKNEKLTLLEWN